MNIPILEEALRVRTESKPTPKCPCCGSVATRILYRVPSIPAHSCILLNSPEAARAFPRRDLELALCGDCGFAFNHLFDESVMGYCTQFEESQHFSGMFSQFARRLAEEIAVKCEVEGKEILEIGCGKGEFLRELCDLGGAKGIGIDPAYRRDPGRNEATDQVRFIADHFGPQYHDLSADAVLCRHTLEHIPHVGRFVSDIRQMTGTREDVWVVFETPDFKRVLAEPAFWDIYYEHCSYFTPGAHARVFRENAFDVTDLYLAYDDQYIIQYAKPARGRTKPNLPLEADLEEIHELAESFTHRVRESQEQWSTRVRAAYASGRSVVLWGGGSKAVSFVTTLGLGPEVDAAVDVNPYKQGKFLPGTGHPVVAPQSLVGRRPDIVIVMNPIYLQEVSVMLQSLELEPELIALAPEALG